jgi:AcrR family transcriptional regulator
MALCGCFGHPVAPPLKLETASKANPVQPRTAADDRSVEKNKPRRKLADQSIFGQSGRAAIKPMKMRNKSSAEEISDADLGGRIRQATMAHILGTSERVFAQAGFGGATMVDLATAARLPKANLHYYFGSKKRLYRAVLDNILSIWISATDQIKPENDPSEALTDYIRAKIAMSKNRPYASKVFANDPARRHAVSLLPGRRFARVGGREDASSTTGWRKLMNEVDPPHHRSRSGR